MNDRFMRIMDDSRVAAELARFNIELNNAPSPLTGSSLSNMQRALEELWAHGVGAAAACEARLLSVGILPTLEIRHLASDGFRPLNRYFALNEQVMRSRIGRRLQLDVEDRKRLRIEHESMLLEAAGTSFQIQLQAPFDRIHRLYNAALVVSAPMLAVGANSPYLFNADLWDESRIPLFEQSLEVGDSSIVECFAENLNRFPVLLPMLFDDPPEELSHLRLHNGTVWRWNRPLIGFDVDGTPHTRIEHRVLPGSSSIVDAVSDAALFYGLVEELSDEKIDLEARLPFAMAEQNLQRAARHGLSARFMWLNGEEIDARALLLNELLPLARRGPLRMGIESADCDICLGVLMGRVATNRNGANWQRAFVARYDRDMRALTAAYLERQQSGAPVHTWPL